jgi:23S rRNA-/tRNA-specific pseudouridylate synthase
MPATDLPGIPMELPYPPRIVAEEDDFLVVDKPPFLRIHPSKPDQTDTLWNDLRDLLAYEIANGGQVSIINRLDRETSARYSFPMPRRSMSWENLLAGAGGVER